MSSEKEERKILGLKYDRFNLFIVILFYVLLAGLFALFIGMIVAVFISSPYQYYEDKLGSADGWLGFWGGLLGGLLGTVAVLVVASWQNKEQREQLRLQNANQEKLLKRQLQQEKDIILRGYIINIIQDLNKLLKEYEIYKKHIIYYNNIIRRSVIPVKSQQEVLTHISDTQVHGEDIDKLISSINSQLISINIKNLKLLETEKSVIMWATNFMISDVYSNKVMPEHIINECHKSEIIISKENEKIKSLISYCTDILAKSSKIQLTDEQVPNPAEYYKYYNE
ncbi:hypothetical protein [Macrococcoides bohemicum]|uniref:hypothetical protein n=1 Tax=Macrococcoides bohemicum TaxID=1903056 RepID=UPI00165E3804|nr:hypothetical protein [Macrococcus bohemicus]MBC9873430.1 hypothetical protein [Macrococcus bohemicus]